MLLDAQQVTFTHTYTHLADPPLSLHSHLSVPNLQQPMPPSTPWRQVCTTTQTSHIATCCRAMQVPKFLRMTLPTFDLSITSHTNPYTPPAGPSSRAGSSRWLWCSSLPQSPPWSSHWTKSTSWARLRSRQPPKVQSLRHRQRSPRSWATDCLARWVPLAATA